MIMDEIEKNHNLQASIDYTLVEVSNLIETTTEFNPDDTESILYLENTLESLISLSNDIESYSYEEFALALEDVSTSFQNWQGQSYSKLENAYFTTDSAEIACMNATNGTWNNIYVNSGYNTLEFLTSDNYNIFYSDPLLTQKIENGFISQNGIYKQIIDGNLADYVGNCAIIDFN